MPISDIERQRVIELLEATRDRLLEWIDAVSPAQWAWRAEPGTWSLRDCAEHIVLVEAYLLGQAMSVLEEAPGEIHSKAAEKDAKISRVIPAREHKVESPEAFRPSGAGEDPRAAFVAAREKTLDFARTTQAELRAHSRPHFALGRLDAYQWLLFTGLHCERHMAQMEEIRAHPDFPRLEN